MKHSPIVFLILGSLALAGCKAEGEQADAAPPPRPVLSVLAEPASERTTGFAGTVQPRYQTELGFRVLGRVITRNVDVGDRVKPGQVLMQLDPMVLDLVVRTREADLATALAQLSNTTAAETRSETLRDKKVVSQAEFENTLQAREAAAASVEQAKAALAKAREQRSYATLSADVDGIVVSIDAEVGQILAPGQKAVTVARTDEREAVVDLPEEVARTLSSDTRFTVALQSAPSVAAIGTVREIAPQADATTRMRRVKITLDNPPEAFRLGATISATPVDAGGDRSIELPLSAVLERDGAPRVWVVDSATRTVKTVPVVIARRDDASVRIAEGLDVGARVVIAGVHSLTEGQPIQIDEKASQ
ncbi:efflux RND transporter periplasmic adaptor subunit [Ancylobacter amanitiformis]|uniref:RND family efflux transporter MFP subunit n=1 Tax=Ancylobacter amanitiformis TaxID=217069 RepID=A0ABU0LKE0_9HYPH|nr:efflux RND transporter periplasmic adaptor subunit [Ancylobacter amanitiformis]MDQ0509172.1 RND family efflux transporter MFP subunit [Ancylobacter amanitiformis]